MDKNCLITGDPITPATDSRAHIIPSALGGRIKPKGLLCAAANSDLNDAVDLPLIRAFESIMCQLDGSRDRGANPSIRMTDAEGRAYQVAFGKPITPVRPDFSMEEKPDGSVDVHVSARTTEELRTLLGRVRKRFPAFDIEGAVLRAAVVSTRPGMLRSQVQIGPAATFPAAFVAANIFAAHRSFAPHPQLASYAASLKPLPDPVPLPPDTFLWHQPRWFEVDAQVSHVLALIGDPTTGRLLAFVEYFNIASIAIVLPFAGSTAVRETYAVDVLTGNEAKVTVDEKALAALPWSASHDLADPLFRANMLDRINRILAISQERSRGAAIERIFNETVGPIDGRRLTVVEQEALRDRLTRFLQDIVRED